jgi:hypothetical protein
MCASACIVATSVVVSMVLGERVNDSMVTACVSPEPVLVKLWSKPAAAKSASVSSRGLKATSCSEALLIVHVPPTELVGSVIADW